MIWPAELIGVGDTFDEMMGAKAPQPLNLPFDVPANEFMNLEGQKISGSRHWAVWAGDFLTRYDPDPLRYYLTVNMPESKDTDWDWEDFYHRNNDELVATWGNLANRVLAFAYKHWEGHVPEPGELTLLDKDLLDQVNEGFQTVGQEIEAVHLRAALAEAMRLASEVNKYLDQTAPWQAVKTDKAAAGRAIYTANSGHRCTQDHVCAFPAVHQRKTKSDPGLHRQPVRHSKRGIAQRRSGRASCAAL